MDQVLAVLAQTADGVYALHQRQRIVFWNAAAERMLGHRAEDVIGRPCHEVFDGEPRPGCLECQTGCPVMMAVRHHASVPTYNLLSRTKEGDIIMLNVSVIVPAQNDSSLLTIHLFRDATHQLRYETYVEHPHCLPLQGCRKLTALCNREEAHMRIGKTTIACGPIGFALQYRDVDGGAPHRQGAGGAGGGDADQGVCISGSSWNAIIARVRPRRKPLRRLSP